MTRDICICRACQAAAERIGMRQVILAGLASFVFAATVIVAAPHWIDRPGTGGDTARSVGDSSADSERVVSVRGSRSSGPRTLELIHEVDAADHDWQVSPASFYGPGLYGRRMGCPPYEVLTPDTQAVAHRTLPCGTLIRFEWHGREIVVPVKDRGPAAWTGKTWDLTAGTCHYLSQDRPNRCNSNPIAWTL